MINQEQESPDVKHYIGLLYLHDSNISMAFDLFQQALKANPKHIPSLVEVATILSDVKPK